jgi:hypothetical protein
MTMAGQVPLFPCAPANLRLVCGLRPQPSTK